MDSFLAASCLLKLKNNFVLGIIASDGTVCVNHSGAEIGQGMNTKVAQAVAYGLGVPIDIIRITCNTTDSISNAGCTGGSGTYSRCMSLSKKCSYESNVA